MHGELPEIYWYLFWIGFVILAFEMGKPDLARETYQLVADIGSAAAAKDAKGRLSALGKGGVPMADIKALRSAAGAQCAMCHGGE